MRCEARSIVIRWDTQIFAPGSGTGMSTVQTQLLTGFHDPRIDPERWQALLQTGDTDVVFLTWHWMSAWWETLGKGQLLLVAAERNGVLAAIAPMYSLEGMVFFLGTGVSDYLDFIGDISDPEVLVALLVTAREQVSDFIGFKFHFVRERSRTGQFLAAAAQRLNLRCVLRNESIAVTVELSRQADNIRAVLERSMLKRENYFRKGGQLLIRRETDSAVIQSLLAEFCNQYTARWEAKGLPSDLADPQQVAFYECFLDRASKMGWIRFLQIEWQDRFLAAELAWYYRGTHFSAPWCFSIAESRHSPGHVLLRQSLLAALDTGLHTYDFGLGDQDYKFRLPAKTVLCSTWGLYVP